MISRNFPILICMLSIFIAAPLNAGKSERQKERERLIEKIKATQSEYPCEKSNRPCKEFLSPSEGSEEAMAYQESVLANISRVGQENFPVELVPLGEDHLVIFSLELLPDGQILKTKILSPSRIDKINAYVFDTLERAAPYPKFEGIFPEKTDVVVVTRSIRFSNPKVIENAPESN